MSKRKIEAENRQFNEEWTKKYFMQHFNGTALCLICRESVTVMKDYNCKRHYETKHAATFDDVKGEARKNKIDQLVKRLSSEQKFFTKKVNENKTFVRAGCAVAQIIARSSRPFTDGDFVKDCMQAICKEVCPEKTDLFNKVPLSRMTIQRRVVDLSNDVCEQLRDKLAICKYFSIALDESTDNVDTAQLLVFVRAVDENCKLTQELAGIASLRGRTTGADIFGGVKSVLENLNVQWPKLCSVTTDGAPAMTGKELGLVAHLRSHLRDLGIPTDTIHAYHCIIHQESLCTRVINFDNVMKFVFKSVNFIRAKGLNHRQFRSFLENIESDYRDIPYHTDVRWLSRGKVLTRFVEL